MKPTRPSPAMKWFRRTLWAGVWFFFPVSGAGALLIHAQLRPSSGTPCGDCITEELRIILNFGAPFAAVAIGGLGWLVKKAGGRVWPVAMAGIVSVAAIAGFVMFGAWLFREVLPGDTLSSLLWWM